ncbi:ABC transporter ATP-binding protein [Sphingomonas lenta]|uniref:Iron ABC transporter ATP-binding protein n=1 Tax=Sphingomonas lenta TaxID=1141887 RepID=A0A2A2SC04_9SPHN|nr:ABC transporter ATP-binding protein [Sphingomonas lenta]PAX06725.1 iron ABC transporter ATP-binding protein [Sphingomonas lenta]
MIALHAAAHAPLLRPTSLAVGPGELAVLLGPNGAGKTTLIRVALGLLPATEGEARVGGDPVDRLSPAERARRVAYLPQSRPPAWAQPVRDLAALGRFAHGAALGRLAPQDAAAVDRALAACALEPLAHRPAHTLSGGELARAHLARALAAEAPMVVADEPVASLDPRHQHQVLRLLRDHVARGGGALVVLHDLDLAARYADRLLWMQGGALVADGSVADTMTPERVAQVYGVAARLIDRDGRLHVVVDDPL